MSKLLIDNLDFISNGALMKCFASKYLNKVLDCSSYIKEGIYMWETVYEVDGWRVQRCIIKVSNIPSIRILEPASSESYWCFSEEKLKSDVEKFKMLIQKWMKTHRQEYGIVFSGGGAKGAYQIGVWKYLKEIGIDNKITGISGASVGALNSLLFLQGDFEKAEQTWLKIQQGDLTNLNAEMLVKTLTPAIGQNVLSKTLPRVALGTGLKYYASIAALSVPTLVAPAVTGAIMALPIISHIRDNDISLSLFRQDKLEKIISEYVDGDAVEKNLSGKNVYSVVTDVTEITDIFKSLPIYHSWKKRTYEGDNGILDVTLTSASLPVVYPLKQLDDKWCIDGGFKDNIPIRPLIDDYLHIIVVHLNPDDKDEAKQWEKSIKDLDITKNEIYHVYPSKPKNMGGLLSVLTINPEITKLRIELGYKDAKEQLASLITAEKNNIKNLSAAGQKSLCQFLNNQWC